MLYFIKGIIILLKNITCSSLKGIEKLEIILAIISNNSQAPLKIYEFHELINENTQL